ncbi:MAG: cytochrome c [Candidatus Acidiferrales bacterium]
MKKSLGGASGAIVALLGIAMAVWAAAAGDASAGKTVYANKCMICHGADGAGATGYAKALGLQPARLASDAVQNKTDAELKKIILEGSGKMKPIKGLSDTDIENVIAYVRTLRKK